MKNSLLNLYFLNLYFIYLHFASLKPFYPQLFHFIPIRTIKSDSSSHFKFSFLFAPLLSIITL